jgi:phospholipase/lecithinase/hemolysin
VCVQVEHGEAAPPPFNILIQDDPKPAYDRRRAGHLTSEVTMWMSCVPGYRSALFAVSALAALLAAGAAGAIPYPKIYAFGDSLSDAGNIYIHFNHAVPVSPPYSAGRFSNGPVWIQDLSAAAGLGALKASLAGGTDYAVGGATTGQSSVHTVNTFDLPAQLSLFKSTVPKPNTASLFTLWIGSNDLLAISGKNLSAGAATTAINQILTNEQTFLKGLVKLGAKHFLVLTVPDLGLIPEITARGPTVSKAATALTKQFNTALTAKLKSAALTYKLNLKIVDTAALIDMAVAKPASYGFTNVKSACWTGNLTSASSGKVCASSVVAQDKHLFWDQLHPTAAGHKYIAKSAETALGIGAPAVVASR